VVEIGYRLTIGSDKAIPFRNGDSWDAIKALSSLESCDDFL
jgi:hypothetical protein